MITEIGRIAGLMDEISNRVDSAIDIYLIGGGAMMFLGCKAATKDVDLVVRGEKEYHSVRRALKDAGFKSIRPGAEYARLNLSDMFEREDGFRVDLFDTRVCGRLELSERMVSRTTIRHSSGNVRLLSCSGSDILIFKSITSRDGDIDDCMQLVELNHVDWKVVLEEAVSQVAGGEDVWITWIADRLDLLSERMGVDNPTIRRIDRMADDFLERWESELLERNGLRGSL